MIAIGFICMAGNVHCLGQLLLFDNNDDKDKENMLHGHGDSNAVKDKDNMECDIHLL